jgi:hypothetical protein
MMVPGSHSSDGVKGAELTVPAEKASSFFAGVTAEANRRQLAFTSNCLLKFIYCCCSLALRCLTLL